MANNNHFELTLDTLAPSGSISGLREYEKENKDLVIDGGDATFKKVWFDKVAAPTKKSEGYLAAEWEAKDLAVKSTFAVSGIYYYHLVLMDDVNNESEIYNLGPCHFDNVKPTASNFVIRDSRGNTSNTKEVKLNYSFNYADADSGAARAVISGEDLAADVAITLDASGTATGEISFKADVVDGNKQVKVVVYDRAENASDEVLSNIILLDRTLNKPVLMLQDASNGNLPEYINYHAIKANLSVTESNIVGYKIWEGEEPAEWTEVVPGELFNVTIELELSAGDGEKTVNAKVLDVAGNIEAADAKSVKIDSVAPTAELFTNKTVISKVEGYNKAILTFGATADNEGGAGINYYKLTRNDEEIASGSKLPANYEVEVGALADSIYSYQLIVRDQALNEKTSEKVTIKMDTTAPTLSITPLNAWYTEQFNIQVSYSDNSKVESMVAWTSTIAADTTVPQGATGINPVTTVPASSINWNLAQSDANYMHVRLIDEVGNVAYAHAQFGYDTVEPVIKTCKFSKEAYPSTAAVIHLTYEDATSGVVELRVSGAITNGTAEGQWEPIVGTRNVTLTDGDGNKTVLVEIRDAAGLVSSKSITCELDTTFPSPVLNLYEADNVTPKAAHSALASFGVRLEVQGDDFQGGVQYKLYGDFNYNAQSAAGIVKDDAEWQDFVKDTGKQYMTIGNLFCTSGDGTKNIYVVVKDNAGNETVITDPKSFVYDTTAPEVTVSDIDYNRISKVHVERRNAGGLIVGKFADETHFTLTPDSVIQAYKVCAYLNASAAVAVENVADEVAIGKTHGSINMSATGLNSQEPVNAVIKGADYEAALGGSAENKVDGAHIVVVYVQDLAGTWSVAAQF